MGKLESHKPKVRVKFNCKLSLALIPDTAKVQIHTASLVLNQPEKLVCNSAKLRDCRISALRPDWPALIKLLHKKGPQLEPRHTNLSAQLKVTYAQPKARDSRLPTGNYTAKAQGQRTYFEAAQVVVQVAAQVVAQHVDVRR